MINQNQFEGFFLISLSSLLTQSQFFFHPSFKCLARCLNNSRKLINFFRLFAILLRKVELTYSETGLSLTLKFLVTMTIVKRTSFSKRAGMNVFGWSNMLSSLWTMCTFPTRSSSFFTINLPQSDCRIKLSLSAIKWSCYSVLLY